MRSVLLSVALVTALLMLSMVPASSASTPEWEEMTDMPGVRTSATNVELPDGRILVTMGGDGDATPSVRTWIYDPGTDEWSSAADAPGQFMSASGVAMPDGKVYIFGGIWMDQDTMTLVRQEEVLIYDVAEDVWTTGAIWTNQVSLVEAVALDDEHILLIGGLDAGMMASPLCSIYDIITNEFRTADALPKPRTAGVAFAYEGDAYYAGGSDNNALVAMKEVFRYDVSFGTWSLYGRMPEGRYYDEGALGDDGLLYLYGGKTGETTNLDGIGTFRIMDPNDCSFLNAPEPPRAVLGAGVIATENGRLILLGGSVTTEPVANVSSLRIFEKDAWLGASECAPGEGVRVYADLLANYAEAGDYSLDVLLLKDGTVLASERISAEKGETASLYLQVPEDLEPGTYQVALRNVRLDARDCAVTYDDMNLNVTEAPSPTDRIGELEDQIADLKDELAGKMDAWVGYVLLGISLVLLLVVVMMLIRKR